MTKIKICGITTINEVKFLNSMDIQYLGFVFTKSKREISIERFNTLNKEITSNVKKVAVFRNNTIEKVLEVLKLCEIDIVQLHGDEGLEFIKGIRESEFKGEIWKAISDFKNLNYNIIEASDKILIDSSNPGEGKVFEWNRAENIELSKPMLLAGGINCENVQLGIDKFKPYAIDLSSGVESISKDGVREKDYNKISELIRKVREYDEGEI